MLIKVCALLRAFLITFALALTCNGCFYAHDPLSVNLSSVDISPKEGKVSSSKPTDDEITENIASKLLMVTDKAKIPECLKRLQRIKGEWILGEFQITIPDNQERGRASRALRGERLTINHNFEIDFQGRNYQIGQFFTVDDFGLEMGLEDLNGDLSHYGIFLVGERIHFWERQWLNEYEGYRALGMYELSTLNNTDD